MNPFGIPAAASAAYQLLAFFAARLPHPPPDGVSPVSILKPVRDRDLRFDQAILSHATQEYPEFVLLFGVRSEADPAVPSIRALMAKYANVRLIVTEHDAPNGKVGVLEVLAREARFPLLLVNDSDIVVPAGYLRTVLGPLSNPGVGLVTCLYRATGDSMATRAEALGIATDFAPGVLVARMLGDSAFALGSTMAFRAADLERIGGFAAIADYIADDYQLGLRMHRLGLRIELSSVVVETTLGARSWGDVWRHQVRWARTIRVSRPMGYAGYVATQTTFWALLALVTGNWPVALAAMLLRWAAALKTGRVLGDAAVARRWWWIPLRDLFGTVVWVAGLAGSNVEWRGKRLRLTSDGRIQVCKIKPS